MTEIRFYHLEHQTLEEALPPLLSKALEKGNRITVKAPHNNAVEALNKHLWTWNPGSFLPHGASKDGRAADQPIWLTDQDENPNNADVLILIDGAESAIQDQFELCCEVFNGNHPESLQNARSRWKVYKDGPYTLTYWQQGPRGWEKKA